MRAFYCLTATAGLVLVRSWTVQTKNSSDFNQSVSFFKKIRNSICSLKKEQFKSDLTVNRSSGFSKKFQINVSSFFTRNIVAVLTFKKIRSLNIQWLIEICHYVSFNFVNFYLSVSDKRLLCLLHFLLK